MDLKLFTIHAGGWSLGVTGRAQKLGRLGGYIATAQMDVACVQGLAKETDAEHIAQAARPQVPFSFLFHTRVGLPFGQPMLLLSKWPIKEAWFTPFACKGEPLLPVMRGSVAGKGVGSAVLDTPVGMVVVMCTQVVAPAKPSSRKTEGRLGVPYDMHAAARVSQCMHLARAASNAAAYEGTAAVVLAGLMNVTPDSLEMAAFHRLAPGMRDAWAMAAPPGDEGHTFVSKRVSERRHYVMTSAGATSAEVVANHPGSSDPLVVGGLAGLAVKISISAGAHASRAAINDDSGRAHLPISTPSKVNLDGRATEEEGGAGAGDAASVFPVCLVVAKQAHKRTKAGALITNLLGVAVLVLGIALVSVAAALPVKEWAISIPGYIIMTTLGTFCIGVSTAISLLSTFSYGTETGSLKNFVRELELIVTPQSKAVGDLEANGGVPLQTVVAATLADIKPHGINGNAGSELPASQTVVQELQAPTASAV